MQPDTKFASTISRAVVIPKAQKVGKTTFQTHSTHKVTEEYRRLAQEIEARLAAFTRETPAEPVPVAVKAEAGEEL
jgi:cellulose biosynthesis protein BcsQ